MDTNFRHTFGGFLVEGGKGSLRVEPSGRMTFKPLGEPAREVFYQHEKRGFGGDCVYTTQRHFIDRLIDGQPFEICGEEYLKTIAIQEAFYQAAGRRAPVDIA